VTLSRDPVSVSFDRQAARLLGRAAAREGQWTGTTLANPTVSWDVWAGLRGLRLLGPDDAPSGAAKTAWCRSFIRSCYHVHRESESDARLSFRVGTVRIRPGGRVAGRLVQVRLMPAGAAARQAADRAPASRRYITAGGAQGPATSTPGDRWWEAAGS
jgi:hypothetical protein